MPPCVLIVGNFLSAHGASRQVCEDLAERLRALGWRVLTASSQRSRAARLADMVGTVVRRRNEYQVSQVDVFSGPSFLWAEAACWALRRSARPYVLALHGGSLPEFARANPGRVRRLLRSAAAVTAPSGYLRSAMASYRADIQVVPNGIDLSAYPFRLREHPVPRLVWLRAFHAIYNPEMAVRVLALLAQAAPDAALTMIGPDRGDGSRQRTEALAHWLGVADHVTFAGPISKAEVPSWLDRHDIFLNTADVDNAPVSVVEAMACGLCIVSTNVGGLPHLLEEGGSALLVEPGETSAAAASVRRVLAEPGLAATMARAGRGSVEGHGWGVVAACWADILDRARCGGVP